MKRKGEGSRIEEGEPPSGTQIPQPELTQQGVLEQRQPFREGISVAMSRPGETTLPAGQECPGAAALAVHSHLPVPPGRVWMPKVLRPEAVHPLPCSQRAGGRSVAATVSVLWPEGNQL